MATIAFDIEVSGFPWKEVDEITRGYLLDKARTPEDREAVPERTGLVPGLGKVIAIGMWNVEQDKGLLLLEGDHAPAADWEKVPDSQIFRGTEKQVLEEFWRVLGRKHPRLVTFNGRGYDGPILMIRSAQLGIPSTVQLVPKRWEIHRHCDLMDVLSFQGVWRDKYSLDYWCRRFDVESPKTSIDGSQVARAYRDGRIEDIGEYCLRDTRATAELYLRLKDTLLPMF